MLFPSQSYHHTTLRQMLEEERHTRIKQLKEVPFHTHIVDKRILFDTPESGHPQQELRISSRSFDEKSRCCILQFLILYHTELIQQSPGAFRRRRSRHTSFFDTIHHRPSDTAFIQIFQPQMMGRLTFPCKTAWVTSAQTFFKHRTRHLYGRTLHLIISPSIIGIRSIPELCRLTMYSYHTESRTFGYINDFNRQADGRFHLCHFMSYFPLGIVRHILAQDFQLGRNTEYQPTTICIEECA